MVKTIIVKTSYEPLDVVFAAARYRIGCKRFVACSRKKSDKFAFHGWQRILSARPYQCRVTWLSSSILLFEPGQRPTALIPATLPRSIHFFFNRLLQQSSECLIACFGQLSAPSSRKELAMGGSSSPGSLPVRARFPCRPRSLQHDVTGVGDKRPGTLRFIWSVLRNLSGPCPAKDLRKSDGRCQVPIQHTASRLRLWRWRRNTER